MLWPTSQRWSPVERYREIADNLITAARPVQNTTVYVNVATTPGASVTASAYFRTGTVSHSATANSAGSVAIAFAVGSAPAGYAVPVRVSAYDPDYKATATAATSFTPVAPPPPPPPPGHAVVSLGTIQYDPPGADTGSNINQEYVTVRNTGTAAQAMAGWTLSDADGHVYTFAALTLSAGHSVVVHTGSGTYNGTDLYWIPAPTSGTTTVTPLICERTPMRRSTRVPGVRRVAGSLPVSGSLPAGCQVGPVRGLRHDQPCMRRRRPPPPP